jgi:hypothetical protein
VTGLRLNDVRRNRRFPLPTSVSAIEKRSMSALTC